MTLGELMVKRAGSVDPAKHPDESFDLYSIPAFDSGLPDVVVGAEIGSSKQVVRTGDVLLSRIVPHIRRAWVVGSERGRRIIASGEWMVFRSDRIHAGWLRHVLVGDLFHSQLMQTVAGVGGSLMRARPAHVATIEVPLPPLPEQRRIAAILDHADALRTKRREALARLDELTQSIFIDMFGTELANAGGHVPLGEQLSFLTSGSRGWARYYAESGEIFLRIQNVGDDELRLRDVAYVDPPSTAEAKRTKVRVGDVVLSITADLGRTAVISEAAAGGYINQHLAILRSDRFEPRFLSRVIASPAGQRQISAKSRGGTKAGLNFDDVRSLLVPCPDRTRQRHFVKRVENIEAIREEGLSALTELDTLFASLQSRAFRGEL
ncbi:restriction endonuclease subunit S [Antrihabitans cavernicola]|uniref:restriction endonuclease subunit S n=1 Tax=Antrihabitans cavernicola TaxID=2495913 RepID=UPI001659171C|nr:restriction endonuclease subunit S [Spelaeibacter cavernicola]